VAFVRYQQGEASGQAVVVAEQQVKFLARNHQDIGSCDQPQLIIDMLGTAE